MGKIIAFAGRMRSGKTELAKVCETFGYEHLYYALPLKTLVANLIGGTIDDVNRLKKGEMNWQKTIGAMDCTFIAQQTKIPIKIVKEKLLHKTFHNTRDILQYVGTELIREYNSDWHVNKIKEMIDENKNYVIDDVRFQNEYNLIKQLNGDVWFVIRPLIDNVSNHPSENTLKWQYFVDNEGYANIIINDNSLNYLTLVWNVFLEFGYEDSKKLRKEFFKKLQTDKNFLEDFLSLTNDIRPIDFLCIPKDIFTYKTNYLNIKETLKITQKDNSLFVTMNNDKPKQVTNTLEIEDLKLML